MKKTLVASLAAAAVLSTTLGADATEDRINALEAELTALKKDVAGNDKKISTINRNTNGNHIKFDVDFRTAYDNVRYEMADGSKTDNDGVLSNRLWLGMNWLYNENLSFTAQLAYNSTYGARLATNPMMDGAYESFDWVSSERAYDDGLRVRKAYFFYKNDTFAGTDVPWTFSIGRRPSTNGKLINLRDDDHAASPMGHAINVEFDGLSSKFNFENVTGLPGLSIKFCAGRGGTYANPSFASTPYANETDNMDLGGIIFVPYDDGQYTVNTQYSYASNLIDAIDPINPSAGMKVVGDMQAFTANFIADGIGEEWGDFLDETIFFVSGAMSKTDPIDKVQNMFGTNGMLGSVDSETGYSYWIGLQMPSFISEEGRWGLEFNHGSKYWRSVTYAEDTMIGSKVAARGDAYEAYFTEPLIDNVFSLQVRYTYIDYDYAGSNGFFGSTTGNSMSMDEAVAYGQGGNVVDKAQDIRVYLRYRY